MPSGIHQREGRDPPPKVLFLKGHQPWRGHLSHLFKGVRSRALVHLYKSSCKRESHLTLQRLQIFKLGKLKEGILEGDFHIIRD